MEDRAVTVTSRTLRAPAHVGRSRRGALARDRRHPARARSAGPPLTHRAVAARLHICATSPCRYSTSLRARRQDRRRRRRRAAVRLAHARGDPPQGRLAAEHGRGAEVGGRRGDAALPHDEPHQRRRPRRVGAEARRRRGAARGAAELRPELAGRDGGLPPPRAAPGRRRRDRGDATADDPEFDDSFWEKYEADWQEQKKLVLQRLRFQATGAEPAAPMPRPPPPPSGKSTAGGAPEAGVPLLHASGRSRLRSARACTHAAAIARLWKLRADGGGAAFLLPHEVTRQLLGSAAGGAAAETRGKKLLECWRAVQAMAEAAQTIRRSSAEPADDAAYQAGTYASASPSCAAPSRTSARNTARPCLRRVRDGQASAARGSGRRSSNTTRRPRCASRPPWAAGLGGGNPMREVVSVGGDDVSVWPLPTCARATTTRRRRRACSRCAAAGSPCPKLAALLNDSRHRSRRATAQGAPFRARCGGGGGGGGGRRRIARGAEEEMQDAAVACGLLRPRPARIGAPACPGAAPVPTLAAAPPSRASRRARDAHPPSPQGRRSHRCRRAFSGPSQSRTWYKLRRPHVAPARPRRPGTAATPRRPPRAARRPRRRGAAGCSPANYPGAGA